MEGTQRSQKRRSSAALAVLTAAALFCMARPTFAQFPQVAPNGVGDLLIYQLWITSDPSAPQSSTGVPRDTLIALIHPFGGQNRFVHIRVREGIRSNDVRDFTVCLSPGDVWTAAISPRGSQVGSQSQLVVGNPGTCDGTVAAAGFTPPPTPGVAVPMGAAFGYIEAFTVEAGGGDDTIMGVASLVNVEAGFSSSWNALAIVGFNAVNENASTSRGTPGGTAIARAIAREGGVDKEVLLARWSADPVIAASTQLVLTFPGGFQPGTADQVSLWIFDEEERFNFSPREIELPWEVNFCNFNFNEQTRFSEFGCIGGNNQILEIVAPTPPDKGNGTIFSGWVRFINNTVGNDELDNIDALPVTRFPVTGLAFSSFENGEDDYDQAYGIQWAAIRGVGGIGGVPCAVGVAPSPLCSSYNLAPPVIGGVPTGSGSFAPWFVAGGAAAVTPGNNVAAALNRTGTAVP